MVPEPRVAHILGLMQKPSDAALTPEVAREVCERAGSAAVVSGSIARLGAQYVLGLRAKSCATGNILDEQQMQVKQKEDVLQALTVMASGFRTHVGEALPTVEKYSMPLPDATTRSMEALKLYGEAHRRWNTQGTAAVLPQVQRALEIDPQFALAHAWLARLYGNMGENTLAVQSIRRAYELRSRASEQERFWIDVSYHAQATGDLEKARQIGEEWAQAYPRDPSPLGFLEGPFMNRSASIRIPSTPPSGPCAWNPLSAPATSIRFGITSFSPRFPKPKRFCAKPLSATLAAKTRPLCATPSRF